MDARLLRSIRRRTRPGADRDKSVKNPSTGDSPWIVWVRAIAWDLSKNAVVWAVGMLAYLMGSMFRHVLDWLDIHLSIHGWVIL